MQKFLDRAKEMAFLNSIITRTHPTPASFTLIYGRRRVGKTLLLQHWAEQTQLPCTYIAFEKETAALQRRKLCAQAMGLPLAAAPVFETWRETWQYLAAIWKDKRHIVILDELPYAADADTAMLSALQHAWDQLFRQSNAMIFLCGSHVRAMETMMTYQSPLFGRLTGQWWVKPFEFSVLKEAFPNWSAEERVAAYAVVGGIPAYLDWLNPKLNLFDNIKATILNEGGMFMAEPMLLMYDELDKISNYLTVIKAIGEGKHTLEDISNHTLIGKNNLTEYVSRLQELRLVERRLPVTIDPRRTRLVRRGRYHLSDPYFRFYFEFMSAKQGERNDPVAKMAYIRSNLRAFIGRTMFEQLAQQWVWAQNSAVQHSARQLPFIPEAVGQHWSRRVQVDVVAINWSAKQILLGECKWSIDRVDQEIVRDLIETKTPKVLADLVDDGSADVWQVHYVVFARAGFTPAAQAMLTQRGGLAIDLKQLDQVIGIG